MLAYIFLSVVLFLIAYEGLSLQHPIINDCVREQLICSSYFSYGSDQLWETEPATAV